MRLNPEHMVTKVRGRWVVVVMGSTSLRDFRTRAEAIEYAKRIAEELGDLPEELP
jgi:hypothetical protein